MKFALLIAWREFVENTRTKGFWFGILLLPVIWILAAQLPGWIARKGTPTRHFVLVEKGTNFSPVIRAALESMERRRIEREWRTWAAARLRPGETLAERSERVFDLDAARAETASRLRTNAGTFVPPRARFREVPLPPGVTFTGDFTRLETDLRPFLRGEKRFAVPGNGDAAMTSLFAAVLLPAGGSDPSTNGHSVRTAVRFWCENQADTDLRDAVETAVNRELRRREYAHLGVDPATVARIEGTSASISTFNPQKAAGEEKVGLSDLIRQWAPSAFVYLLWVAIFSIAQMLLNSVIEEKSNRIIEVLLSSVTPGELMTGKLIGIASVGLVMVATWIGTLAMVALYFASTSSAAAGGGSSQMAQLPMDVASLLTSTWILPAFALYFLFGYVLYAGIFLAIGSTCNTVKEAQNYMGVVVLLLMVPLLAMTYIPRDPNGPIAVVLSWIPLYTPFTMMNRVTANPPIRDVIGTLILLLAFDVIVIWACGRIFRIAVLRTGQPPTLRQLLDWIRGH
jgi:ABC-2 type transport system permease protein